ncbi:MAG TPA: phosphoribosylformylglycinamidine cyclo-ligase [Chitinivibrionales bacterium]|nr:phosphoribosylformylglycinamidine cyclo-ligase [Chitinivibrionales bacterium]
MSTPLSYADAGVNIPAKTAARKRIVKLVESTFNKNVVGKFGHFGGMFSIAALKGYKKPILVSSVDGVGTKLKIAAETGVHHTVGMDIVNHCINDILVLGAKPLYFLDYIATGKLEPDVFIKVVSGLAKACKAADCVLIGGETAEMPGMYQAGEYDIAGTIVGVVDEKDVIDGSEIRKGDVIIGLRSDGLHTNGYSLARKIVKDVARKTYFDVLPETGRTLGEELLRPHRPYSPVLGLMRKGLIRGCAHITGGGFVDNVDRILPKECDAAIDCRTWTPDPIFTWMQKTANVQNHEMYRTFNMGIGMVLVVKPIDTDKVLGAKEISRFEPRVVGTITQGKGKVNLTF